MSDYELDLIRLAQTLLGKWKTILISAVLAAAVAFGITFFLPKEYTCEAVLLIEHLRLGSVNVARNEREITSDTFLYFLTNGHTLERTIQRCNLRSEDGTPLRVHELAQRVKARIGRNTGSLELKVTMEDPETAWEVARTIVEEATGLNDSLIRESAESIRRSMAAELDLLRQRFAAGERAWQEYLVTTRNDIAIQRIGQGEIQLRTIEEDLNNTRAALVETRAKYDYLLARAELEPPTKVLRQNLSFNEMMFAVARERVPWASASDLLPMTLEAEIENYISTRLAGNILDVSTEYLGRRARLQELEELARQQRRELEEIQKEYNETRTVLDRLQRQYEAAKEAYVGLHLQYSQIGHEGFWEKQQLRLLAPPVVPSKPTGPRRSLISAAAMFLGGLGAVVIVLGRRT